MKKFSKPTKADLKFAKLLKEVIKGFNRRLGKKGCGEMDGDCFDCQTRWVVGILNSWISVLEFDLNIQKKKNDK